MNDPVSAPQADLVLLESTYGDRLHRSRQATVTELGEVFQQAAAQRGNVLIPAFAVGRSQEILYWLARHYEDWQIGQWQIYLDSPMALRVTDVYSRHCRLFDRDGQQRWRTESHPLQLANLRLIHSVQDSQALNARRRLHHHCGQRHVQRRAHPPSPAPQPVARQRPCRVCGLSGARHAGSRTG